MERDTLQLVAGFAHDLRTPLSAIAGHATLLSMGVHGPLSEAQAYALSRVEENQKQLNALIGELMRYAEAASGTLKHVIRECALGPIVSQAVADAQAAAVTRGVRLEWLDIKHPRNASATDANASWADIAPLDETATRAIVSILVDDALARSEQDSSVQVGLRYSSGTLHVVVESDAPALADDLAELLFVPYARNASGRPVHAPGRSLALPYARALARSMGADVSVASTESRTVLQLDVVRSANLSASAG